VSNRKFVKVEQAGKCPTEWLIDLGTVVRMHPDSNFVVFDDGAGMNLTRESADALARELEAVK